jgi:hypothetical protein
MEHYMTLIPMLVLLAEMPIPIFEIYEIAANVLSNGEKKKLIVLVWITGLYLKNGMMRPTKRKEKNWLNELPTYLGNTRG